MGLEPRHGFRNPLVHVVSRLKAEQLFGSADIQTTARLAIWLGRVPNDATRKADFRSDHLG
jgi:hypothetical protein